MNALTEFFTPEAGQARTAWLNDVLTRGGNALNYYLGPTGIPDKINALGQALEFTDAGDYQFAAEASRDLWNSPSLANAANYATAGAALAVPFVGARMATEGVDVAGDAVRSFLDDARRYFGDEEGAFGGVLAKTADLDALARAQRMGEAGASRDAIWKETGWFQGVDGKWRFEIPDAPAQYKPGVGVGGSLEQMLEHPALYEAYPEMRGVPARTGELKPGTRGQIVQARDPNMSNIWVSDSLSPSEARSTLLHEVQHNIQQREGFDFGSNVDLSADQAKNYSIAIKNTPEVAEARAGRRAWDRLREEVGPIWNAQADDKYARLIERGKAGTLKPRDITRMNDFYAISSDIRAKLGPMPKRPGPERDEWLTAAAVMMRQKHIDDLGATGAAEMRAAMEEFPTPRERNNAARRYERQMDKYWPAMETERNARDRAVAFAEMDPRTAYYRNSGEVEARNVQSRQYFTADEITENPPWSTMTAPPKKFSFVEQPPQPVTYADQVVGNAKAGRDLPNTASVHTMADLVDDPAASRGAEILDLLRTGRASEVTDDMLDMGDPVLNARLNEYLFNNYDLPMDEASRMARAGEMGFPVHKYDGESYHLTPSDVTEFKVGRSSTPDHPREAVWARLNPRTNPAAHNVGREFSAEGVNDMPLFIRGNRAMPFEAGDMPDGEYLPYSVSKEWAEEARARGYSQYELGNERISIDPSNIRSRFARFDPRLAHLRNLLAGVTGGGFVAANALTQNGEQQ